MATWMRRAETLTRTPIFKSRSRNVSGLCVAIFVPANARARRMCRTWAKADRYSRSALAANRHGFRSLTRFSASPWRSRTPRRVPDRKSFGWKRGKDKAGIGADAAGFRQCLQLGDHPAGAGSSLPGPICERAEPPRRPSRFRPAPWRRAKPCGRVRPTQFPWSWQDIRWRECRCGGCGANPLGCGAADSDERTARRQGSRRRKSAWLRASTPACGSGR